MTLDSSSMGQLSLFSNTFTPQPLLCPHWSNDTQKIPFANHCSFDDFWQAAVQNWLWQIQTRTWQSPWDAFKRTLPKPAFFISRCVRSPSQEASAAISIFYRWWCLIYAGYFFVSKCICLPLSGLFTSICRSDELLYWVHWEDITILNMSSNIK